jgi:hypothetical protein
VEPFAADDLGANLQNRLGVPVQDLVQRRVPVDLGLELGCPHAQESTRGLTHHLHRKREAAQIDGEPGHTVAADEID